MFEKMKKFFCCFCTIFCICFALESVAGQTDNSDVDDDTLSKSYNGEERNSFYANYYSVFSGAAYKISCLDIDGAEENCRVPDDSCGFYGDDGDKKIMAVTGFKLKRNKR